MYGLPPETDLAFLVGSRLEQVAIGENEIIFRFELSVSINVQGDFSIGPEGSEVDFESSRAAADRAAALLSHVVAEESHTLAGDLVLKFDNGILLTIRDSSKQYESYEIRRGDETWIV
jgi:hypothetical protein